MLFNLLFVSILSNPTYVSVHLINHSVMAALFKTVLSLSQTIIT